MMQDIRDLLNRISCPKCMGLFEEHERHLHVCPIVWTHVRMSGTDRWQGHDDGQFVAVIRRPNPHGYWLATILVGGKWQHVLQERQGPDSTVGRFREIDSWLKLDAVKALVEAQFREGKGK